MIRAYSFVLGLMMPALALAQEPLPKQQKVYEIGKERLKIEGKLTKGDPPLVNAPLAPLTGAPHQVFLVALQKRQSYVIELKSGEFDAYLILQNALGTVRAHDDDSGGGLNSRIVYVAPADGAYRVVVAALDRKPGAFELTIRSGELSEEQKLSARAWQLNDEAQQLHLQRKQAQAIAKLREVLAIRQKLYPTSKYPDGHEEIATSQCNLGALLFLSGQVDQALPLLEQSLATRQRWFSDAKFPNGHTDLIHSYSSLANAYAKIEQFDKALVYCRGELAMHQRLFPTSKYADGHVNIADSLLRVGEFLTSLGRLDEALDFLQQDLAMNRRLFPSMPRPVGIQRLAFSLNRVGTILQKMGQHEKAFGIFEECLALTREMHPRDTNPHGHQHIAANLANLAAVLQSMARMDEAIPYLEQCEAMYRKLFPMGHPQLATCLCNFGAAYSAMGKYERALPLLEQSLEMSRLCYPLQAYPNGHPELAHVLDCMAPIYRQLGRPDDALRSANESLAMYRRLMPESKFPDGNRDLAVALNNYAGALQDSGYAEKALPHYEQSLAMLRKVFPAAKYPDGHHLLAHGLNNMGYALQDTSQFEKALSYFEQSLAMRQSLFPRFKYPDGHPDLAMSLNNTAYALQRSEQWEKAMPYYVRCLAMQRKLFPESKYPDGHPDLAQTLNNLGALHQTLQQYEQASAAAQLGVAMYRKLYPKSRHPHGHPNLAQAANTLAMSFHGLGQTQRAVELLEENLVVVRKFRPSSGFAEGHHDLMLAYSNLAAIHFAFGNNDRALEFCDLALPMHHRLWQRELLTTPSGSAFDRIPTEPLNRDLYLTLTRSGAVSALRCYEALWPTRSMISRTLERRQAAARTAGAGAAEAIEKLRGNGRRTEQVLHNANLTSAERDQKLAALAAERDRLERDLIAAFPSFQRAHESDALGPKDLAIAMRPGDVLIDLIKYTRIEFTRSGDGKLSDRRIPSYVAFLVANDQPVHRVELGDAAPIDAAVLKWRQSVAANEATEVAAAQVGELVWKRLSPHILLGAKTIYCAPDADLARLPWAALPIGNRRLLIDEYAVAVVPHGPFLLEQLKFPAEFKGVETVLAVGDVAYRSSNWPSLPGTSIELKSLSVRSPVTLTKSEATAARVLEQLPTVRFAHFATHGFFDEATLSAEKEREDLAYQNRRFGEQSRRTATKNPLGFVGLVLSGSEVLSGLSIVDLDLRNTKLVTLSACETGLGEHTGGEGVQGLQRAFHLAGCRNVVASLWKVNDAATGALMTKFYHEMWVNKKPPIEALREAQLTIYHHPELIPDLAGERGAPRLKEAVTVRAGAPATGARTRVDTKRWAAFVLSGVGR